ncbi:MAG: glucose-6-phosphate isomerase [Candidatus Shapirobacteria bacterium]|nr:glucose-6-phosphate isomerase [Candidatus Shapirobacteria bacterium]
MMNIKILDDSRVKGFINEGELSQWSERVSEIHKKIHEKTGEGNDFLGWLDLPVNYNKEEFDRIKTAAEKIRNDSDVLVVIDIGGPYLSARSVIGALSGDEKVEIYFTGHDLSSLQMIDLLKKIENKNVSLAVISKSGTTTEPAVAFRILREWMENKYGQEANKRICAVTDRKKGTLKKLSTIKGYETFIVPDDVGGRYSALTPMGLLPMAVAGINIEELINGAQKAREDFNNENLIENDCYKYAVYRNIFYQQSKLVEVLASYEPCLFYMSEWWKQLFGESEGKDKKGIFPATVSFTADLHSMGQYMQDGNRILMETVLSIEDDSEKLVIKEDPQNLDELNFVAGKTMDEINKIAMESTVAAHTEGGVPNLIIRLPKLDEFNLGYLIYFFQKACAMSGYLLGVNPFNQPGVEVYKKKMFALLGKPGV